MIKKKKKKKKKNGPNQPGYQPVNLLKGEIF